MSTGFAIVLGATITVVSQFILTLILEYFAGRRRRQEQQLKKWENLKSKYEKCLLALTKATRVPKVRNGNKYLDLNDWLGAMPGLMKVWAWLVSLESYSFVCGKTINNAADTFRKVVMASRRESVTTIEAGPGKEGVIRVMPDAGLSAIIDETLNVLMVCAKKELSAGPPKENLFSCKWWCRKEPVGCDERSESCLSSSNETNEMKESQSADDTDIHR